MYDFCTGFFHADTMEVQVADLHDPCITITRLGLGLVGGVSSEGWRELRYRPDESIECGVLAGDARTGAEAEAILRKRWPRFVDFLAWAWEQPTIIIPADLSLNVLTSARGLVIPQGVRDLYLNGLTSADGLTIPQGVELIYLAGLTSARGLVIPRGVKSLYLAGLTSADGLVIPPGVELIHLDGLTSARGLHIPPGTKWLYLDSLPSAERKEIMKNLNR